MNHPPPLDAHIIHLINCRHLNETGLIFSSAPSSNGEVRLEIITTTKQIFLLNQEQQRSFLTLPKHHKGESFPEDIRMPLDYCHRQIHIPWRSRKYGSVRVQANHFSDGRVRLIFQEPIDQPYIISSHSVRFLFNR
jgi:hypothetical protein